VALACLMIPESSSRWWARRRYRFLNPFKLLRTMSANKPDVCSMAILGSLYLNWRYLPCIWPIFQAYVGEYPNKIYPYILSVTNMLWGDGDYLLSYFIRYDLRMW
jgi:hypothetical protein